MRILIMAMAALLPTVAFAQRPVTIGLAGGVSAPQGELRNGTDVGWHALGTIGLSSIMVPLGIRVDAAYNRFASRSEDDALGDGHLAVLSLTGNLSYRLPMWNSPLSPYLIGGMGAYRSSCSGERRCAGDTEFGWNVGLGTRLYVLGFRSFVEARYHRTERGRADVHYFPLTFGIVF